jgi:hypothetical protein
MVQAFRIRRKQEPSLRAQRSNPEQQKEAGLLRREVLLAMTAGIEMPAQLAG